MSQAVSFTIPGTPPSVNHYLGHTRAGKHYRTKEAEAWDKLVFVHSRGQVIRADNYSVTLTVFFKPKQRTDLDNICKVGIDSLVRCGVIDADSKIFELHLFKGRDAKNPRLEIAICGG